MKLKVRLLFLFIFLACAGLLGYAIFLQEAKHLLPCPLCVAQRIAYWLVGLTALAAFVHNPQTPGRRGYSSVMALFALAGAAVAAYHSWLIRHPQDSGCSISAEETFINSLPLAKAWPGMFAANGDCAHVAWKFLTLTIPDWSLFWFMLLFGLAVYTFVGNNPDRKETKIRG